MRPQVIIVGAGPSGLLLALLLTSLSPVPQITILEQAQTLNRSPRATHYNPVAVSVLRRAGVIEEIRRRGYMPTTLCWRTLHGPRLCRLDRRLLHDDADAMTVLGVGELCAVLAEELERKGVEVTWGQKVVALGGTAEESEVAWVESESVETGERKRVAADFVVGCDGGNSSVRRLMFGKGNFPGFTWDEQIVATNVSPAILQGTCLFLRVKLTEYLLMNRPTTTSHEHLPTGKTQTLSWTKPIGTWQPGFPTTTCGASATASCLAYQTKSF